MPLLIHTERFFIWRFSSSCLCGRSFLFQPVSRGEMSRNWNEARENTGKRICSERKAYWMGTVSFKQVETMMRVMRSSGIPVILDTMRV